MISETDNLHLYGNPNGRYNARSLPTMQRTRTSRHQKKADPQAESVTTTLLCVYIHSFSAQIMIAKFAKRGIRKYNITVI